MGTSVLFSSLDGCGEIGQIPLSRLRAVFESFGVALGEFEDGSHAFTFVTPAGSPVTLHDEASISVDHGLVTCVSIDRPSSPASYKLWFALLDIGFVMVTAHDGQVFARPNVARAASHLFPRGIRTVERPEDFSEANI